MVRNTAILENTNGNIVLDPALQKVYIRRKEERKMIIKNAIRCNICGEELESKHRHDYVECKCGACAVDGGHDYLRRCYKEEGCYTEISICTHKTQKSDN